MATYFTYETETVTEELVTLEMQCVSRGNKEWAPTFRVVNLRLEGRCMDPNMFVAKYSADEYEEILDDAHHAAEMTGEYDD